MDGLVHVVQKGGPSETCRYWYQAFQRAHDTARVSLAKSPTTPCKTNLTRALARGSFSAGTRGHGTEVVAYKKTKLLDLGRGGWF
jgi:hypothetical protein